MNSIFELGRWDVTTENFMDSKIIYIDNFYKMPRLVKEFTINPLPKLWKATSSQSKNGCFYLDRRLAATVEDKNIDVTLSILSQLIGQRVGKDTQEANFKSNVSKFLKHSYNDIKNNCWWPHIDCGYNAIISLNTEFGNNEYPGTALYHPDDLKPKDQIPDESSSPWISKTDYRLVKHIKAKYNRCVLFDGLKFPHAMHINDYTFFDKFYRVNQVYFFEPHD